MIRAYFDSSAIFKLTREEPESQSLIDYLDQGSIEVTTSVLSEVEVVRNLRHIQMESGGVMQGFYLIELDAEIRRAAAELGGRTLRSLDAVHIASAVAVGDRDLEFVTYDDRQAEAARAAGLKVVQPGR